LGIIGQSAKSFQLLSKTLPCGILAALSTFWVMFFWVPLGIVGLAVWVSLKAGRQEN